MTWPASLAVSMFFLVLVLLFFLVSGRSWVRSLCRLTLASNALVLDLVVVIVAVVQALIVVVPGSFVSETIPK